MWEVALLKEILDRVARGEVSPDEAETALRLLAVEHVGNLARIDVGREVRHGVPEVVIAEGKSPEDVVEIAARAAAEAGRAIVSRVDRDHIDALERFAGEGKGAHVELRGRTVVVRMGRSSTRGTGGRVGVMAAGTSDIAIAQEAEVMAAEMGCEVVAAYDVGVAGVHRVLAPLREMIEKDVDAIVVVAGREGALPTLLAGMVDVPIIAVPASTGYGLGEKGVGALMAMLQSCSLGLAVVNIDGGIPAGAVAASIANRAAKFRRSGVDDAGE